MRSIKDAKKIEWFIYEDIGPTTETTPIHRKLLFNHVNIDIIIRINIPYTQTHRHSRVHVM